MRRMFPGYYSPTKEEFVELWTNCLFVLDANVLLNLYRYSSSTSTELLEILEQVSDRLWVPHQAALEYQKNRLDVIVQQTEAYSEIEGLFQKTKRQLETELNTYRRHPSINVGHLLEQVEQLFNAITEELGKQRSMHPDLLREDSLRERITSLLDNKAGSPYPLERLKEIYKEGEERYSQSIAPGYLDAGKKSEREKYGDLILWFQIIDKAHKDKRAIILVTDDTKDDWWWKFKGRTIGPRQELVEEILAKAGVSFYMYGTDLFMGYARDYLSRQVNQGAIDEVREIREREEETMQLIQKRDRAKTILARVTEQQQESLARIQLLETKIKIVTDQLNKVTSSSEEFNESVSGLLTSQMEQLKAGYETESQQLDRLRFEKVKWEHTIEAIEQHLQEWGVTKV